MTDAQNRGFGWRLGGARLALFWERLWPSFWPLFGVAMAFVAISLLEVWTLFPGWLHATLLALFAISGIASLILPFRRIVWPKAEEARRRLETESGLSHRPLTTVTDQLAGLADSDTDPLTAALWDEHQRRARRSLRFLRIGLPKAGWLKVDPWGIRAALALLLVIGFVSTGTDSERRLLDAFRPGIAFGSQIPAELDAWITPPEYTGLAPAFLTTATENGGVIRVPEGSTFFARIHGGKGLPQLRSGAGSPANTIADFNVLDELNYEIEKTLDTETQISIIQNEEFLGVWPLEIIPDLAPEIAFHEEPVASARFALRLAYAASDDYGVDTISVRIQRADTEEIFDFELPIPTRRRDRITNASFHDLTPHPWAGLPVFISLSAVDEIGQVGNSEQIEMILPERDFRHPVARAIIDQRRVLALRPARQLQVASALTRILAEPARYYDDTVAFLSLRSAIWRLVNLEQTPEILDEVVSVLWDTALRIEDGELSQAEAALRAAQDAMLDALARDAPDSEIDQRIAELREALNRFLQELAERALADSRNDSGDQEPIDPSQLLGAQDLQDLLDRAQELSRAGARDAARELLSQLREMLENLRDGIQPGQRGDQDFANEALLNELNELLRGQQELLDDTFRRSQQGQRNEGDGEQGESQQGRRRQGSGGPSDLESLADRQERLRRMLGSLMQQLGDSGIGIPDPLGRAKRSMKEAFLALEAKRPREATGPQTNALDQLRDGAGQVIRNMMEALSQELGFDDGPGDFRRIGRDPFGRPQAGYGPIDDDSVKIPDQLDVQRAREILRELYRRAGERKRPLFERDYIERLLRRF
jgi:uncharacterized protein (TIGR02302 family)